MIAGLWLIAVALAFAVAYAMNFYSSTLKLGRALSGVSTGTGYQDAITPPWSSDLALCIYSGQFVLFAVMAWKVGWGSAFGSLAVMYFGAGIAKLMLPKAGSPYFVNLIFRSMMARYADYLRDGDKLRAETMKELLEIAGVFPD